MKINSWRVNSGDRWVNKVWGNANKLIPLFYTTWGCDHRVPCCHQITWPGTRFCSKTSTPGHIFKRFDWVWFRYCCRVKQTLRCNILAMQNYSWDTLRAKGTIDSRYFVLYLGVIWTNYFLWLTMCVSRYVTMHHATKTTLTQIRSSCNFIVMLPTYASGCGSPYRK